jgi:hypothetical protein
MTTQNTTNKTRAAAPIPNVLVPLAATDDLALLKRLELARAISVSPRTLDNLQKRRIIPFIKISARCVRFHLPSVILALRKLEIREAGR